MALVQAPRYEGSVKLEGGRRLGFAEYGEPSGRPVLWFHGTPGARKQIPNAARRSAEALGVRLICVERPGVGSSTPHAYPGLLDWAVDMAELTRRLHIERYAVVGLSGGGPYALACAHAQPDRVVAAALLGGVAPARGEEAAPGGLVQLAAIARPLLPFVSLPASGVMWAGMRVLRPLGPNLIGVYGRFSPADDRALLADPEFKEMFLDDLNSGSRRRFRAVLEDLRLFSGPWGFDVSSIAVPTHVWHGDEDNIVPVAHAEHLANLLPNAELRIRPGESHLGNLRAAEEILAAVVRDWP